MNYLIGPHSKLDILVWQQSAASSGPNVPGHFFSEGVTCAEAQLCSWTVNTAIAAAVSTWFGKVKVAIPDAWVLLLYCMFIEIILLARLKNKAPFIGISNNYFSLDCWKRSSYSWRKQASSQTWKLFFSSAEAAFLRHTAISKLYAGWELLPHLLKVKTCCLLSLFTPHIPSNLFCSHLLLHYLFFAASCPSLPAFVAPM